MEELLTSLQTRLKLIEQRLTALNEEHTLLVNERDHVADLIDQYTKHTRYYDTIEAERTVTKTFIDLADPNYYEKHTLDYAPKRKPRSNVTDKEILMLAEALEVITIKDIQDYFDNPPSQSMLSRRLTAMWRAGKLTKISNYPVKYAIKSTKSTEEKEDADE